ncbi:MAG: nuclear transport factor 2 family protein [Solirubrobacterales bacterium]
MSPDGGSDLALLQGMLDRWGRGEFWDAEPYAEDVVFVRSGPDGGEYHGIEGLAAAWQDFLAAWEDFRIEAERVVPGAAGVYVLLVRLQARGKGSGMNIDAEVANVVRMRDGRIARLEMFWDRDAALSSGGVREGDG